jgi:hypothetical protein
MAKTRYIYGGKVSFSNISRNNDGNIRQNASTRFKIDRNMIKRLVRTEVRSLGITADEDKKPIKTEGQRTGDASEISKKKKWGWKLSAASATMMGTNALSMGTAIAGTMKSTDKARMEQMAVKNAANYGILAMGTLGGPAGMVGAIALSFVKNSFGDILFNNMQRQHDNRRLAYKLNNYDLGKQSTRIYDYNKQNWISEDAENAKRNILGRN